MGSEDPLAHRNRELSVLYALAEVLNRTPDLEEILGAALAKLADLFDLHTAWIWLLDADKANPYLAAAQHLPTGLKSSPERMGGSCFCLDTYAAGDLEGAANINFITCSRLQYLEDTDGLRYHTSVPLYADEKKLGVLNVASADWRELSDDDLQLLHTAGDILSIAIERARLFNRSRQLGALEERNRLAREIHDTLAQGLTAIAMNLENVDDLLADGRDPAAARATVRSALQLTRGTLEEARRSVQDLRASPLEDRSLTEALHELAESYRRQWKMHVVIASVGKPQRLPARIELALFRIAQEALTNAQRHAAAEEVTIQVRTTEGQTRLIIFDNGRGFDPGKLEDGRFGLIGMNERVRLIGGTLEIQSTPGEGTRLVVSVPF